MPIEGLQLLQPIGFRRLLHTSQCCECPRESKFQVVSFSLSLQWPAPRHHHPTSKRYCSDSKLKHAVCDFNHSLLSWHQRSTTQLRTLSNTIPSIDEPAHQPPINPQSRPQTHHKPTHTHNHNTKMTYRLLILENPLLDIQASVDTSLLSEYGLKPNDAILAEEKHLSIYQKLESRDAKLIAGGAAQNTARGAQYLLPSDSVVYLGAVGDDQYAKTLDEACAQAGLATRYLRLKEHPTGRCGVCITGHDRSMVTDLAAANHYTLSHLQSPGIWALAEKAEVFYVGGYHLTVCPDAAVALGKEAAKRNVPFVFGMGAPFIPLAFGGPLEEVLGYADVVFQNETEAASWAESTGKADKSDLKAVAKAMAGLPKMNEKRKRMVVITQGTDPTLVAEGGEGEVKEFKVHAIDKGEINDTNGAGDAFAGGFLAGLVEGKDLKTCVDMGMWLAAKSLRELGPSYVDSFPFVVASVDCAAPIMRLASCERHCDELWQKSGHPCIGLLQYSKVKKPKRVDETQDLQFASPQLPPFSSHIPPFFYSLAIDAMLTQNSADTPSPSRAIHR